MEKQQIKDYEYCKKHLADIDKHKEHLDFGIQKYGCGTGSEKITFTLERVHNEMYQEVQDAMNKAKNKIQSIIDKL